MPPTDCSQTDFAEMTPCFKECLIELLQDMFGEESVPKALAGDTVTVTVDSKDAVVSLQNMTV